MRRDWKQHPLVVAGLLAAAALVWGALLLRIQTEQPATATASQAAGGIAAGQVVFVELPYPEVPRDPFAPWTAAEDVGGGPPGTAPPATPPAVRHRLQGVIGRTALLVDPAGSAHLVRAGDAIGELEVVAVDADRVRLRIAGHSTELALE